jgi:hypothetical protein
MLVAVARRVLVAGRVLVDARRGSWAVATLALVAVTGSTAPSRASAPVDLVALPAHALIADPETPHAIALFAVEGRRARAIDPASVRARRGVVDGKPLPLPGGGLLVRYRAPRGAPQSGDLLEATIGGATLRAPIALEPASPPRLELRAAPDPIVVGRDARGGEAAAEVTIRVRDAHGRPRAATLRLGASVGALSPVEEMGPGEYRARYTPPVERYPQVAILVAVALDEGGAAAVAATAVRLAARIAVSGVGEPGASMSVTVDGRTFGPTPVGADGRFQLPIVVPPGGRAVGVSTDRMGNVARREIDLALPPFPRLLLATTPAELPADGVGRAEIVVVAVDARGALERRRAPELAADRGTLGPLELRPDGTWRASWVAPRGRGPGAATITARAPDGSRGTARIALRPAPPFHLALDGAVEPLPSGADDPVEIRVRVTDGDGAPVEGARLEATLAGGRVVGQSEGPPGVVRLRVVPPRDPGRGRAALHVELGGLRAGPPRRVGLQRAPGAPRFVEAWVDDDVGTPVPDLPVALSVGADRRLAPTDRFGVARFALPSAAPEARHLRLVADVPHTALRPATLDLLLLDDGPRAVAATLGRGAAPTDSSAAPGATLDVELPLRPLAPLDVRISVEPGHVPRGRAARVTVRLTDAGGARRAGPVVVAVSSGRLDTGATPAARRHTIPVDGAATLILTPDGDARPGDRILVTATEPTSGLTAFTEVTVK